MVGYSDSDYARVNTYLDVDFVSSRKGKPRSVGVFDPPRSLPGRRIEIDGECCSGLNRAQAGKWNSGPGPGCGLGTGEAPRALRAVLLGRAV